MKVGKIVLVDGFTDLPFGLGSPPFLGPEVRYTAGACWDRDDKARVIYVTHEDLRAGRKSSLLSDAEVVMVYAGHGEAAPCVRPSGGINGPEIAPLQDLVDYIAYLDCPKVLGGPYVMVNDGKVDDKFNFDVTVTGDLSKYAHGLLSEGGEVDSVDPTLLRTNEETNAFAILGAGLAVQNNGYPSFISCAVELYRGCPSASMGGCSFCHETRYTTVEYRPVEDVVAEVAKLAELGCENLVFDCPCFFSYFSSPDEEEGLSLDPSAIEKLLEGTRSVGPELRSVHVANINPGVIARNPDSSKTIVKLLLKHCSDGNFPNFRVVTFDDEVALQNNTQSSWEETTGAIEMLAEHGSEEGPGGLPRLLPTVELVYGLAGEREETLDINLANLRELSDSGRIRGVLARNLVPVPGTPISKRDDLIRLEGLDEHLRILGEEINQTARQALAEPGRLIRDVFPYRVVDEWAAAKKIGVNPVELRVHGAPEINSLQDVRITSVGNGELEAVAQPLIPKTVSREILRLVPSMTEEIIDQFMRQRPQEAEDFYHLFDEPATARVAAAYFDFSAGE